MSVTKNGDKYVVELDQRQAIVVAAVLGQLGGSGIAFDPYHELATILDDELGPDALVRAGSVVRMNLADHADILADDEEIVNAAYKVARLNGATQVANG